MTNPYQVLGAGVPNRFGRTREADDILSRIDGNHIMVVAPRFFGKTVFLRDLKDHPRLQDRFPERIFWDLTVHTPTTDEQFWSSLTEHLKAQLSPASEFFAKLLKEQTSPSYECIADVFTALQADKREVLLILDGVDDILPTGFVSRNVLDNLRDLGQIGSLKFITGSRKTLREICPASLRPSPFLNIFHTQPVRLGAFSDADWPHLLAPFEQRGLSLDSSATAELKNWSGGVPVLAVSLCHEVWASHASSPPTSISKQHVDACADVCRDTRAELLARLWDDCDAPMKAPLSDLAQGRELAIGDLPTPRFQELTRRGYIHSSRAGLKSSCRLLQEFIQKDNDAIPDIKRLFAVEADYSRNIQPLLALRLDHLHDVDSELRDYVEMAIHKLEKPHLTIVPIRSVTTRALEIIWDVELPSRSIPEDWTRAWQHDGMQNPHKGRLGSPTQQCRVLDALTDDRKSVRPTKINRQTYLLVQFMQEVGDYGQHKEGDLSVGFAAAVCLAALELCNNLIALLKSTGTKP